MAGETFTHVLFFHKEKTTNGTGTVLMNLPHWLLMLTLLLPQFLLLSNSFQFDLALETRNSLHSFSLFCSKTQRTKNFHFSDKYSGPCRPLPTLPVPKPALVSSPDGLLCSFMMLLEQYTMLYLYSVVKCE